MLSSKRDKPATRSHHPRRTDGGPWDQPAPTRGFVDPGRSRWDGVLDPDEIAYCRSNGIEIGYDPAQIGWVVVGSDAEGDDLGALRPASGTTVPATGPTRSGGSPRDEVAIVFRSWTTADVDAHRALLGDPSVWEHLPEAYPEPFDRATSLDLIELASADLGHEVVAVEVGGQVVGQCLIRFEGGDLTAGQAEVAYWLGREHWGRGLMSRILPAFVDRCWDRHPVERLEAWIHPANVASERVAARVGFEREDEQAARRAPASPQRTAGFLRWTLERPR